MCTNSRGAEVLFSEREKCKWWLLPNWQDSQNGTILLDNEKLYKSLSLRLRHYEKDGQNDFEE